jgi:hypothetical protein
MDETSNLNLNLSQTLEELENAVERFKAGSSAAYISIASSMRKLVGYGRGNDLVHRVIPKATMHKLVAPSPLPEEFNRLSREGQDSEQPKSEDLVSDIFSIRSLKVSDPVQVEVEFDRDSLPVLLPEWRDQQLKRSDPVSLDQQLKPSDPPVSLGQFIQELANKEAVHVDDELGEQVRMVDEAISIRVGEAELRIAPAIVASIGEYVLVRTRELLATQDNS